MLCIFFSCISVSDASDILHYHIVAMAFQTQDRNKLQWEAMHDKEVMRGMKSSPLDWDDVQQPAQSSERSRKQFRVKFWTPARAGHAGGDERGFSERVSE